jgi:hypothetical protein
MNEVQPIAPPIRNVQTIECTCQRCHYQWMPSGKFLKPGTIPKICPSCKSKRWQEPYSRESHSQRLKDSWKKRKEPTA